MNELTYLVAEMSYPFPAKFLERELLNNNIEFKQIERDSYEGDIGSTLFYIHEKDIDKAKQIKDVIVKENAESELQHIQPIKKVFAYVALLLIAVYLIYKMYKIF
ncbi:hypothetical protein [Hanstruepera flava]|uniref:hypothetical protein n=1 Tax=Hanstruepera flava TaxID=2930218 RepID=UPI0020294DE0|nr:hypothetical protein [Hanstruepera flava]